MPDGRPCGVTGRPSNTSHHSAGSAAPARTASASEPYTLGFRSIARNSPPSQPISSSSNIPCHPIRCRSDATRSRRSSGGEIVSAKDAFPASSGHVRTYRASAKPTSPSAVMTPAQEYTGPCSRTWIRVDPGRCSSSHASRVASSRMRRVSGRVIDPSVTTTADAALAITGKPSSRAAARACSSLSHTIIGGVRKPTASAARESSSLLSALRTTSRPGRPIFTSPVSSSRCSEIASSEASLPMIMVV